MAAFRIVYPNGSVDELVGSGIEVGDVLSGGGGYVVAYVQRGGEETIAYLDPVDDDELRKTPTFVVDGQQYRMTLAETAELADRVRRLTNGDPGHPATAVAIRLEQLVEEGAETPADMLDSEKTVLRLALEDWLVEVGPDELPRRVMDLRLAMHGSG